MFLIKWPVRNGRMSLRYTVHVCLVMQVMYPMLKCNRVVVLFSQMFKSSNLLCEFHKGSESPVDGSVIDLKILVKLGALKVLLCDHMSDIAEVRIQGKENTSMFHYIAKNGLGKCMKIDLVSV